MFAVTEISSYLWDVHVDNPHRRSRITASCGAPESSWLVSLARDPFPDVRGAVAEFDAPRFGQCQQAYRVVVNDANFLQIDGDGTVFLIDRGPKDVNVVPCNPAADAQHHINPFSGDSIDSAGHDGFGRC